MTDKLLCLQCGSFKLPIEMVKKKETKSGYRKLCKPCHSLKKKQYKENLTKVKELPKPNPVISIGQKKSCGLLGYTGPRIKDENEALPQTLNKMSGVYKPQAWLLRSGAQDHLQYKSKY